jgi:hypothetical protein
MEVEKKIGPFDFIKSISKGKRGPNLIAEDTENEKVYLPFITNRTMSYFVDSILISNELNRLSCLPNALQFELYRSTLRAGNRFAKFAKSKKIKNAEIIMQEYGYSNEKALAVVDIFTDADIKALKKKHDQGGLKKR